MPVRRIAEDQPESFEFDTRNLVWARAKMAEYPAGMVSGAVVPILWRAQEQSRGWLPEPAIRRVADLTGVPYLRVFELATFYTMFRLEPVGALAHIEISAPDDATAQSAADAILKICRSRISPDPLTVSADGQLSWEVVPATTAPSAGVVVAIGSDLYEGMTPEAFGALLDRLVAEAKSTKAPAPSPPSSPSAPEPQPQPVAAPPPARPPKVAPQKAAPATIPPAPKPELAAAADAAGKRPPAISPESTQVDDLRKIRGIGPVIEQTLHDLGIYTYAQVAAWTEEERAWVNTYLAFKGRIDREEWVEQAAALGKKAG